MVDETHEKPPLATAIETFERHRPDLLSKGEGRWVLIHDEDVVGLHDTREEALRAGYRAFPGEPFLVRQVLREQEPLIGRTVWF